MDKEKVAVIILNYNTWRETLEEARQVHELFGLTWEQIIIVDNASPNDSEKMLRENKADKCVLIVSDSNKGYAAGNNTGLRYARSKGFRYGLILNNDIIIEDKELLSALLSVFQRDRRVAVVNPDIFSPDGHLFNRDSKRPTLYDFTAGALRYRREGRKICDKGGYGYVYRPQGCCMMTDIEKLEKVGYMDENTFLYCEEMILAERLLKKGWRCACLTGRKVIHDHSSTVKSVLGKWKVLLIQNRSFSYYLKEYRGYDLLCRTAAVMFYTAKNIITN